MCECKRQDKYTVYEKRKKKKRKTCIIEELLIESLSRKVAA
jgi:hypothetical protein